jgi:hypothetical protein
VRLAWAGEHIHIVRESKEEGSSEQATP